MQHRIPKQTLLNRAVIANIRLLHPDYEYVFFDDAQVEAFIDREFPHYRSVFDSYRLPIQRCDFFRYLAVYRHGGFYLDSDVLLASSLSGPLGHRCVFPFEMLTVSHFMRNSLEWTGKSGTSHLEPNPSTPFLTRSSETASEVRRMPIGSNR